MSLASPTEVYRVLIYGRHRFNTFETNLLTIPSAVATIITMWMITIISETIDDRSIVAMMEDLWLLPFLIALRALPDNPDPWLFYVSFLSNVYTLLRDTDQTLTVGVGDCSSGLPLHPSYSGCVVFSQCWWGREPNCQCVSIQYVRPSFWDHRLEHLSQRRRPEL